MTVSLLSNYYYICKYFSSYGCYHPCVFLNFRKNNCARHCSDTARSDATYSLSVYKTVRGIARTLRALMHAYFCLEKYYILTKSSKTLT